MVAIDLQANTIANFDITFSGFENVVGTDLYDSLLGDDGPNLFDPLRGGGNSGPVTGGPDSINGRGGVDILRIDFTRYDGPELSGVFTNGGSITRTSSNPALPGDSYLYTNMELLQITGASKNDLLYPTFSDYDDILIGNAGNDFLGDEELRLVAPRAAAATSSMEATATIRSRARQRSTLTYTGIAGGVDVFSGGAGDDLIEDIAFSGFFPVLASGSLFSSMAAPASTSARRTTRTSPSR